MVVSTSLMQFFLDPLNPITCFWISCGVTCIDRDDNDDEDDGDDDDYDDDDHNDDDNDDNDDDDDSPVQSPHPPQRQAAVSPSGNPAF